MVYCIFFLDSICSSELASRDKKLKELNEKYSSEHKLRVRTEKQKDKITVKLVSVHKHYYHRELHKNIFRATLCSL